MGEKDTTEKILADYNDVFADIINGLVFKGEQKVTPESLENISTRSVYKGRKNKLHEQERDIVKLWKERDIEFAIYGMENQTLPEKYMPLRILGYDGASYRSQLQKKRKRPVAVLTIVLYFGTDKMWDKPTHLKDVIYIPEGLGEYVNDYKITVFNIAWLTEEEIAIMKYIGAKDGFVRAPFIIEGILIGLVGAAIPLGILYVLYNKAITYILTKFSLLNNILDFLPVGQVYKTLLPVGLLLGIGIGFVGSFFTIRKHLRV